MIHFLLFQIQLAWDGSHVLMCLIVRDCSDRVSADCLVRVVSIDLNGRPLIQGIIQYPIRAIPSNTKLGRSGQRSLLYLSICRPPPQPLFHQTRERIIFPEFLANLLAKVVSSCRAFVILPLGVVVLGMKVQHWPPVITQAPPFLPGSCLRQSVLPAGHLTGWV